MPYRRDRVSNGRDTQHRVSDEAWERRWRELGYDEEMRRYYETPVEELYHRRYEQPSTSLLLHKWRLGEAPRTQMVVKLAGDGASGSGGYLRMKFTKKR